MVIVLQVTSMALLVLTKNDLEKRNLYIFYNFVWLLFMGAFLLGLCHVFGDLSVFYYWMEVVGALLGIVVYANLSHRLLPLFRPKKRPTFASGKMSIVGRMSTELTTEFKSRRAQEKKAQGARGTSLLLMIFSMIVVYMVFLIPLYRSASTSIRLLILLVAHPLLKAALEYLIRDAALRGPRVPRYACARHLFSRRTFSQLERAA